MCVYFLPQGGYIRHLCSEAAVESATLLPGCDTIVKGVRRRSQIFTKEMTGGSGAIEILLGICAFLLCERLLFYLHGIDVPKLLLPACKEVQLELFSNHGTIFKSCGPALLVTSLRRHGCRN